MLSFLLKILAALGIIILILLGILLLLILMVLFLPIIYKVQGQITEERKYADVNVRWLFGALAFTGAYSEKLTYKLKFLGFDLTGLLKKKQGEPKSESKSESESGSKSESSPDPVADISEKSEASKNTEMSPQPDTSSAEKEHLPEKLQKLILKVKELWERISYYINLLKEEDTKQLISHCRKVIFSLLKSIRPRKLELDLEFGFDSPDTTGKLYGILCMLYPYYDKNIHIRPDFENQIFRGRVFCKGRIIIGVLVWNALRILTDKKLYKVIHKLKNGGKQNGR